MQYVICWRCQMPGHIADECDLPAAASRKELLQRIDRYVERWQEREITTAQKQAWIAAELRLFNPKKRKAIVK